MAVVPAGWSAVASMVARMSAGTSSVWLALAGAAPVGLDLGDRPQDVAVDAGRRAGLEGERDPGGRCYVVGV